MNTNRLTAEQRASMAAEARRAGNFRTAAGLTLIGLIVAMMIGATPSTPVADPAGNTGIDTVDRATPAMTDDLRPANAATHAPGPEEFELVVNHEVHG